MNRFRIGKGGIESAALAAAVLLLFSGCASSPPERTGDPELSSLSRAGRDAYERGEFKLSARLYRMARDRARLIDDPGEIGTVTYNLAAAALELGENERAEELLAEARRAFSRGPGVPADLVLLQGRLALLAGRVGEAEGFVAEGLAAGEEALGRRTWVQFRLLEAEAALAGGDPESGREIFNGLGPAIRKIDDPLILAGGLSLEGELLFLEGDFPGAGKIFDREAELLRKEGRYRGMTRARSRAGAAYLAAEDFCPAAERFYRASRALFARGETLSALEEIRSALAAAEQCPEETIRAEVGSLFIELRESLPGNPPPVPPGESE